MDDGTCTNTATRPRRVPGSRVIDNGDGLGARVVESHASAVHQHQVVGIRDREVELGRLEGLLRSDAARVTSEALSRFAPFSGRKYLSLSGGDRSWSGSRQSDARSGGQRMVFAGSAEMVLVLGALKEDAHVDGINYNRIVGSL